MRTSSDILAVFLTAVAAVAVRVGAEEANKSAGDFYMSTDGSDAWSGRLPAPNGDRTDGPFATIQRARDGLRELHRKGPDTGGGGRVLVRGGTYRLTEPIVLGPEDSGRKEQPIVYSAYPGEKPVFSGGRKIEGWRKEGGEVWCAEIPDVKAGRWYFNQLFVGGQRRTRARTPNEGYLRAAGPLPGVKNPRDRKDPNVTIGFSYRPGDLRRWDRFDDVTLVVYHSWTASLHWIADLDEPRQSVRFRAGSGWPLCQWEKEFRYYVENARELLDAPGEWYLNRETGVLYYWPVPGEEMAKVEVVAPVLRKLVVFAGDLAKGAVVHDVRLEGLVFEHADWDTPKDKTADGQAAAWLEAAMFARGAERCCVSDCAVRHVGEYGIHFEQGCKDNRVVRCHVHDLGAGGVRIGHVKGESEDRLSSLRNTVDNCFIHDGGHVFRAGIGVWVGKSSYNAITHNEICDFDYTGISVGWSWGYQPSSAHHNRIEFNRVHHIGNGVLSDMGGIYTLGISTGTVIRNNIFHDVYAYDYGGWGLYTDEGSTEIVLEDNVVYNTKTGGFHQHYGRENVVRNNILAFSEQGQVQRSREEEHYSFTFERNIVYFEKGTLLSSNWKNGKFRMDNNVYWDAANRPITFSGKTLEQWQAAGFDRHSVIADPLFVDASRFDFGLKVESPALKLGFKPIDVSRVGLYGDASWVGLPKDVKHRAREVRKGR